VQILITGCAGYIGSVISKHLIDDGFSVIGLDNLSTGFKSNLDPRIDFYLADISNENTLREIKFKYPSLETVIHLAAFIEVSESVKNPEKYLENNFRNSKDFLHIIKELGFKNIIYSSTAAVYTPNSVLINEDFPTVPVNPYGLSKLLFEKELKNSELNYIIFRFFNVAGADERFGEFHEPETHLIPLLIDFALGLRETFSIYGNDYSTPDGTAIRDYVHVKDLALAHRLALNALINSEHSKLNEIYNLGYGKGFSVKEIVNTLEKILNKKLKFTYATRRAGDPDILVADPAKALNILGFKPEYQDIETIINDAFIHRKFFYKDSLKTNAD
jgi:UDP-glucose 4-epimerase